MRSAFAVLTLAIVTPNLALGQAPPPPPPSCLDDGTESADAWDPDGGTVGVLITEWGTLDGFDDRYVLGSGQRARVGQQQLSPFQACTDNFVGTFPFRSQMGLIPHAVVFNTPDVEVAYDGFGIWQLSADGTEYVSPIDETVRMPVAAVNPAFMTPMIDSTETSAQVNLEGDPRTGENLLPEFFQYGQSITSPPWPGRAENVPPIGNGISDYDELGWVATLRSARVFWEDLSPRMNPTVETIQEITTERLEQWYGDRIDLRIGFYESADALGNQRHDDVAVDMASEGITRMVMSRETPDNNNYANKFMSRGIADWALCNAGLSCGLDIKQVRQTGRTPEYNTNLMERVRPHLEALHKGDRVAMIYNTHGLPWPGSNPEGPFAAAHPWVAEVYHENAYFNYMALRAYLIDEFGEDYDLVFHHEGASGDKLHDNYYAYAMTAEEELHGVYPTLREQIDEAKAAGHDNVVIMLSHWYYNTFDSGVWMRDLQGLPFNSREALANRDYAMDWCESPVASGAVECGEDTIRIQMTEAFESGYGPEHFAIGYAARLRGGVERFGVMADLGVNVHAHAPISKLDGGVVEVTAGKLAGAKLEVPADPAPGAPEGFDYFGYQAGAFTAFDDPADARDASWFNFEGFIASQRKGVKEHKLRRRRSRSVLVGPYRTLFNRHVSITIPYTRPARGRNRALVPFVYNEATERWDPVYIPPTGAAPRVDTQARTVTFDTNVLGIFALAEVKAGSIAGVGHD